MERIYINISTLKYKSDTMPRALAWTTLVVSVALLVTVATVFVLQGVKLDEFEADIELINRKKIDKSVQHMSASELKKIAFQVKIVNELIERESYSWVRLLTAIEASVPKQVYVTQVSPDLISGKLSLSGFGGSYADVNNFIDKMNLSEDFEKVVPVSQSIVGKGAYGSDTVSFSIKAKYLKEPSALEVSDD